MANGNGRVAKTSFTDFDHLTGGAKGADTFVVTPRGGAHPDEPVALSLDGGGRHDGVIVKAKYLDRAAFTTTGPKTGTIEVDGMVISHARMSQVELVAASARAGGGGRRLHLHGRQRCQHHHRHRQRRPDAADGDRRHSGTKSFAIPTASLTIQAPGDYSAITLGSMTLPGVDLTAQSGATGVNLEPLVKDITNTVTVAPTAPSTPPRPAAPPATSPSRPPISRCSPGPP